MRQNTKIRCYSVKLFCQTGSETVRKDVDVAGRTLFLIGPITVRKPRTSWDQVQKRLPLPLLRYSHCDFECKLVMNQVSRLDQLVRECKHPASFYPPTRELADYDMMQPSTFVCMTSQHASATDRTVRSPG